jgi:GxxExxY protein
MKDEELTGRIIGAFFKVYNTLGYGFLEKVYENALFIELSRIGLTVEKQKKLKVFYGDHVVGDYSADLIVEGKVICELKTSEFIVIEHEYQLINYLKATTIEIGLLLNFGKRPEVKRKVFDNDMKSWITSSIPGT